MRFHAFFPAPFTVFVVIHVEGLTEAWRNLVMASLCGVKAAFLINHNHQMSDQDLIRHYHALREQLAENKIDMWLGLNTLRAGLSSEPERAFKLIPPCTQGVWFDNLGIDRTDPELRMARRIRDAHQTFLAKQNPNCLLFGAFAFKGQTEVAEADFPELAPRVFDYADVLVTSGPGTGTAPAVDKIRLLREAIGPTSLMVVASGMTAENVHRFQPFSNGCLVASGISRTFTEFDADKVERFMEAVRKELRD
jgi:hypothetical protein